MNIFRFLGKSTYFKPFHLLIVLGIGAVGFSNVHSQPNDANFKCVAIGKPGSKVKANGEEVNLPAVLDKCEGSVALSDEINVCYRDQKKQRKCSTFKKNQVITLMALAASGGDGISGVVLGMARGDVQTLAGQTRSLGLQTIGMPFGPVLAKSDRLEFDLTLDPKLLNATNLQIIKDGTTEVLVDQKITQPIFSVIMSNLPKDVWYRWVIEINGKKMSGKFLLVGNQMDSVRVELNSVEDMPDVSPVSKAYLKAEIFNENSLVYERILAIQEFNRLNK